MNESFTQVLHNSSSCNCSLKKFGFVLFYFCSLMGLLMLFFVIECCSFVVVDVVIAVLFFQRYIMMVDQV